MGYFAIYYLDEFAAIEDFVFYAPSVIALHLPLWLCVTPHRPWGGIRNMCMWTMASSIPPINVVFSSCRELLGNNYSLASVSCVKYFNVLILKPIVENSSLSTSCEMALRWTLQNRTNEKVTLLHVMPWSHQASSCYMSHCWLRSLRHMVSLGYSFLEIVPYWVEIYLM